VLATQKTFAAWAKATGAIQAARTTSAAFIGLSRLWQICKGGGTFEKAGLVCDQSCLACGTLMLCPTQRARGSSASASANTACGRASDVSRSANGATPACGIAIRGRTQFGGQIRHGHGKSVFPLYLNKTPFRMLAGGTPGLHALAGRSNRVFMSENGEK
jgi:hypothetical protein